MDIWHILVFCVLGIAGCAALVFLVETAVAFWFHEDQPPSSPQSGPVLVRRSSAAVPTDKAA